MSGWRSTDFGSSEIFKTYKNQSDDKKDSDKKDESKDDNQKDTKEEENNQGND